MHRFRTYAIALATAVASLALAPRAEAQTITACAAKQSGSMYRVGVTGTPVDCTSTSHVKATWNVQGPQGPQGSPGMSGYEIVTSSRTMPPGAFFTVTAYCPTGKRAIGGGVVSDGSSSYREVKMSYSGPTDSGTSWESVVHNGTTVTVVVRGRAVCATVAP